MDAETWTLVRDAFARVQEAPSDGRQALLDDLQPGVRAEVESLLAALAAAGGFLTPPGESAVGPGAMIGPYRLLEELGRGGMGVVYRAERNDGEFRREVALKIAGGAMFTPDGERRFIQERQLLARLEHPGIVRLLDGGIAAGRRYFAMELVRGAPITDHCRKLELRQRLRLFRDVCAAVSYAHQHLILHRDLKPGNILVTEDGAVKILDFGIARPVGPESPEATGTLLQPMSLHYASPEQLRGAPLTLASDVYALGLLLYELLTGTNPRRLEGAGYAAAIRHAMEHELPPPSRVARRLPRDLDAIVTKAMAEDPANRYASVAELEAELGRHLDGHPVLAVPPSATYLLSRFLRRHRVLALGASALAIALALGAGFWARQTQREARRFEDARRLVHTVIFEIQPALDAIPATLPLRKKLIEGSMEYLDAVSQDVGGNAALLEELSGAYLELSAVQGNPLSSNLGDFGSAKASLDRAEALLLQALAASPGRSSLLLLAARVHIRLAEYHSQHGQSDAAFRNAGKAVTYADQYSAAQPEDPDGIWWAGVARFTSALAMPAADWKLRVAEFGRAAELALEAAERSPADRRYRRSADSAYRRIAEIYAVHDQFDPALEHALKASRLSAQLLDENPGNPQSILDAAADAAVMGEVYDYSGRDPESLPHYRRAMELLDRARKADPANTRIQERLAVASRDYAEALIETGKPAEATVPVRRALDLYESLAAKGQLPAVRRPGFAYAWFILGQAEDGRGNRLAACEGFRTAVERLQEIDRDTPLASNWRDILINVRAQADVCKAP
ncbi:MAG: serine/threonine protein kinase [Bryobacterales bacterium]|nr:serine/threonine protein kinase [Bryobacterales bacterium]